MKLLTALESARDILLAAKRVLSANELHGSAPSDKVCGPINTRGGQYVDGVHQNLDVRSRASDPSKPYTHLHGKRNALLFARLLGARFAYPIDGGIVLRGGQTHYQEHHGSNPLSSTRKSARLGVLGGVRVAATFQ